MKKLILASVLFALSSFPVISADALPVSRTISVVNLDPTYLGTAHYGNFDVALYIDAEGKVVAAEVYDTVSQTVYSTISVTGKYVNGHVNAVIHYNDNGDRIIKILNYPFLIQ